MAVFRLVNVNWLLVEQCLIRQGTSRYGYVPAFVDAVFPKYDI